MRTREQPLDPMILRELAQLDDALAGRPAEEQIALIVRAVRDDAPQMGSGFERRLGQRVADGFPRSRTARSRPRLVLSGAGATAVLAALVAVLVIATSPATHRGAVAEMAPSVAAGPRSGAHPVKDAQLSAATAAAPLPPASPTPPPATTSSQPRQVEQSANLVLSAPNAQVQNVADRVVSTADGLGAIIESSNVSTAADGGSVATFSLLVPSARFPAALDALSSLAPVSSRTENTQDVTDTYNSDQRAVSDAQAARQALLRQLAKAMTAAQVSSIRQQLGLVSGRISSTLTALRQVEHQVQYTSLGVSVQAGAPVAPGASSVLGGGLSTALTVLETSAAIALVILATLVPLMLVGLIVWRVYALGMRRRRADALSGA